MSRRPRIGPAVRGARFAVRYQFDFFSSFGAGLAVLAVSAGQHPPLRVVLGADVFFLLYVGQMIGQARRMSVADLRERGGVSAGGGWTVLILTGSAMALSFVAIFLLLNHEGAEGRYFPALAIASVPLSWAMLHTHAAFHYAKLYYTPGPDGAPLGGLRFPEGGEPDAVDLLYYAFVVGTSASVSDVSIASRPMRVATMTHSIASFTFNAVLLAVAVNAAMNFAGP